MPPSRRELLLMEFSDQQDPPTRPLTTDDLYEIQGLMDTADLLTLASLDLPALRDPMFHPVTPPRLASPRNIFDVIREGDVLLHHPYDSFQTSVERFIQTAAEDPDVLAIKLTLYRTGGDSSIARMLVQAAERGKQVAVLIELQARFDEENNIIWAQRLEDVGVHVSYGVAGLKTHAKVMLVVRRATRCDGTCTSGRAHATPRRPVWAPTSDSGRRRLAPTWPTCSRADGVALPLGYRADRHFRGMGRFIA
jgi:polyphosphate kinase